MCRLELRQEVKNVGGEEIHLVRKAVALHIRARHFDRALGYVHRRHVLRAALCGVERKGARVREAIEHALAARKARHGKAVELLVEEKARLLPVFDVHAVENAVFADLGDGACGCFLPGKGKPALILR